MKPTLFLWALLVGQTMAFGQVNNMTHEETVVRTAYAKFAYASEQNTLGELALEADGRRPVSSAALTAEQRLSAAQVNFTLSNFKVGDISEILNRKAAELITPAQGEMLKTNGRDSNYADLGVNTHWSGITVKWVPARGLPVNATSITIDEMYQIEWDQPRPANLWQRYASYEVTVSFQGKTRGPYKALFLFGHDAKGNEAVEPKDATVTGTGLISSMNARLYPDAFILTRLRKHAVVSNWLSARQMTDASCAVGKGDVCCDLARLQCGPGRADVAAGLSTPLPGKKGEN